MSPRGSESHYIIMCRKCKKVMGQCRCPSKDKTIHYETCEYCKVMRKNENDTKG